MDRSSRVAGLLAVALSGAIATAVFTGALEARLAPLSAGLAALLGVSRG